MASHRLHTPCLVSTGALLWSTEGCIMSTMESQGGHDASAFRRGLLALFLAANGQAEGTEAEQHQGTGLGFGDWCKG